MGPEGLRRRDSCQSHLLQETLNNFGRNFPRIPTRKYRWIRKKVEKYQWNYHQPLFQFFESQFSEELQASEFLRNSWIIRKEVRPEFQLEKQLTSPKNTVHTMRLRMKTISGRKNIMLRVLFADQSKKHQSWSFKFLTENLLCDQKNRWLPNYSWILLTMWPEFWLFTYFFNFYILRMSSIIYW